MAKNNIQGSRTITRRPRDGDKGNDGSQGAFSIQKDWIIGDTHHNTSEVVDFIYVRGDSGATSYWYKKVTLGTNVASTPPQGGVTPYTIGGVTYEKVSWLDTLGVKTFIAEDGNLGGLIFKHEKLISQTGTINGQGSFVPNIIIDGNTGYVEFANAKITGNIQADGGNLGVFVVEENGNVTIFDPDTLVPRLVFSANNLPDLQDLLDGTSSTGGVNIGAGSTGTSQTLSGTANVLVADGNATMTECAISISASGRAQQNGMSSSASAKLWLYRNGTQFREIGSAMVFFSGTSYEVQSDTFTISSRDIKLGGAGTYTFRLITSHAGDVYGRSGSSTAFRFDFNATVQGVKRQQYGLNGMMFFYSNNHFYYTEEDGLNLRGGNLPGVLLSGTVLSSGGGENFWGAKQSSNTPVKNSTGRYTVYHTIGHNRYSISALPKTANRSCHIVSQSNTNFVLEFRSIGSSPALADTAFTVQVTGDNY